MSKKLFSLLAFVAMSLIMWADSFTGVNGETFTYTVQSTSTPSSGVKHTRMRFSAPNTTNVSIVEVDMTDPTVRVEAFMGQDKMFKTETLTAFDTRKRAEGRNPVAIANAHFWSMSTQTGTDAGVYATTTLLGGAMVNGSIITETNSQQDQWNGGPADNGDRFHGVMGITTDGKAYIGSYQTLAKVICAARGIDYLTASEVNKYCHVGGVLAMFTPEFTSTKAIKIIDSTSKQAGTDVTGTAESTELYLKLKSGYTVGYNKDIVATVEKVGTNEASITRGDYDFVLVATAGTNKTWLDKIQVGDEMTLKYYWHSCTDATDIPSFENLIAGNAIVMKDGALTDRNTNEDYNSTAYARTLYGVSSDNKKLIMAVVDKGSNNSEGISYGTTTARMACIMKQFGADDVLNCDGGGSAQLVVDGTQVSKSSDSGGIRAVASGIVVYSTDTSGDDTETDIYTEVTPASGTANPYAFEVNGSVADNKLTVNYVLNTAAASVAVVIKKDGSIVKTIDLGSDYCTEAVHTATVELSGLNKGDYTWGIQVTGEAKSAVQEFKSLRFNHPQGIDTDRNFESPYFGRIYVTEGRSTTNEAHYSYANGGQGLYMFTPRFVGIQNWITGTYAHTGGVTFDQTVGTKSGADFRKVRVAEDGRIFVTRQNDSGDYLLEVPDVNSVVQTNAAFTSVFSGGSLNTTTYAYENGSTFVSAPNIGFDLKGSGDDLTLAMLSGQATQFSSNATSATRVDEYKLGTNANWSSAPSPISQLSGQYTVNYSGTNLCYDNKGGIWYSQYRDEPSTTNPALVYIAADGEIRFADIETARGGGGIRFNHDFTQIAMASSLTTFSIYNVSYSDTGNPILDEQVRITHGMGKNINDFAWDRANNIYVVGNTSEYLKAFSIPRANNTFVTDAASTYGFTIEVADLSVNEEAEEGYHLTQEWAHTEGHLAATAAKWATAYDGKIYVNDKANSKLYYWSEDGLTDTGITSATGSAITSDDAGNIILSATYAASTDVTSLKILPAGGTAFQDLVNMVLPSTITAAGMQYIGSSIGNVMSSGGGAIYLFPQNATAVAKIVIESGAVTGSDAINVGTVTADMQSFAVPLTSDIYSTDIAVRVRGEKHFYHSNGTTFEAYSNNGINTTSGGTIFELAGVKYAVEPIGTSYRDGFQIVDLDNNKVVAKHTEELTSTVASPNPNCIVARTSTATAVKLYQFVPGQLATMYTFSIDSSVGIDDVENSITESVEPVEYYNVQGVKVEKPSNGIYIKKQGNKTSKVVL